MNISKAIDVLTSADNRKAVGIGAMVGTGVVIGACAFKVAGLGLAGKLVVTAAIAGAAGYIVKQKVDDGTLNSLLNDFAVEMSNSKVQ